MGEVAPSERRTGLLIPVREAEPLVGDFRRRHNAAAVARFPPHVTVLFPFAPVAIVDERLLSAVAAHFAQLGGFTAELREVGRFDDYVWLGPHPRARFVELLGATWERFPEYPPYEGMGVDPEPHLTIGAVSDVATGAALAALAERELRPGLPFRFSVDHVSLFEEQGDGTWRETTSFPLG